LQLVVGLDKGFGLKISDPGTAKEVLKTSIDGGSRPKKMSATKARRNERRAFLSRKGFLKSIQDGGVA
jgi:hypothetical protein